MIVLVRRGKVKVETVAHGASAAAGKKLFNRSEAMNLPKMYRVRQTFDRTQVKDIPGTVKAELDRLSLKGVVKPGQRWRSQQGAGESPTLL